MGEPTVLHAGEFERLAGAKPEINRVPLTQLYQEPLLGLRQNKYDVLFFGSMWIADLLQYLEPLPDDMWNSPGCVEALEDFVAAQDLYPKGWTAHELVRCDPDLRSR